MRARRALAITGAAVFACGANAAAAAAAPRTVEIDLRDSTYLFDVPGGSLGPFKSDKLDAASAFGADLLLLHAVVTNRDEPGGGAHGEFLRIEDDRRLGASTVRVAAGIGGGVLGQRSATVAFAAPLTADHRLSLSAAIDMTALDAAEFQRIVGIGPELRVGRAAFFARYYRPSVPSGAPAPSSASILASAPVGEHLALVGAANFGGEVNADRTSGFLPTSSGRYGTDVSLAARAALGAGAGVLAGVERARYRSAPTGAVSRTQHIITVGFAFGSSVR